MGFEEAYKIVEGLLESIKDVVVQYVDSGKVPKKVFNLYVEKDQTPTKKYVGWMCKQYVIDPSKVNHYPDVVEAFDRLNNKKLLQKKDIYQYSYEELEGEIKKLQDVKTKGEIERKVEQQVDKVYEDEEVLVLHPKTKEASNKYGKKTKWCISSEESTNYFDQYTRKGSKFYFVIDKTKNKKYAVEVSMNGKKTVWSEKDTIIEFSRLLSLVPALKKAMQ